MIASPGRPTRLTMPFPVRFGLRAPGVGRSPSAQARRFYEPQKHNPFNRPHSARCVLGRSQRRTNIKAEAASKRRCASPPRLGAAGRPLTRGLRAIRSQFELGQRFNPSHHPNPSPMLGPARRKTAIGFPARRTIAAQSSPQFSAPCPPHCGSATAPPVPLGTRKMGVSTLKCRPRQFLPDWPSTNRQNMPFQTGGRRSFCE